MAGRFEATVVIDRPIEEVFAFLADGENDPKFSPRVLEIAKTTDGPPGVGTVYASTVKDAGMKTQREFKLTEFEAPTRIRWAEQSKNLVTATEGGYDLAPRGRRAPASRSTTSSRGTASGSCRAAGAARRAQGRRRLREVDQGGRRGVLGQPGEQREGGDPDGQRARPARDAPARRGSAP